MLLPLGLQQTKKMIKSLHHVLIFSSPNLIVDIHLYIKINFIYILICQGKNSKNILFKLIQLKYYCYSNFYLIWNLTKFKILATSFVLFNQQSLESWQYHSLYQITSSSTGKLLGASWTPCVKNTSTIICQHFILISIIFLPTRNWDLQCPIVVPGTALIKLKICSLY